MNKGNNMLNNIRKPRNKVSVLKPVKDYTTKSVNMDELHKVNDKVAHSYRTLSAQIKSWKYSR